MSEVFMKYKKIFLFMLLGFIGFSKMVFGAEQNSGVGLELAVMKSKTIKDTNASQYKKQGMLVIESVGDMTKIGVQKNIAEGIVYLNDEAVDQLYNIYLNDEMAQNVNFLSL